MGKRCALASPAEKGQRRLATWEGDTCWATTNDRGDARGEGTGRNPTRNEHHACCPSHLRLFARPAPASSSLVRTQCVLQRRPETTTPRPGPPPPSTLACCGTRDGQPGRVAPCYTTRRGDTSEDEAADFGEAIIIRILLIRKCCGVPKVIWWFVQRYLALRGVRSYTDLGVRSSCTGSTSFDIQAAHRSTSHFPPLVQYEVVRS